jgi:hypothetical protein
MNQISSALVAAGVKVPCQSRRIWNYLKDHPQLTTKRISQALSINVGSVSSLLAQMAKQNRAESKLMLRSTPGGGMCKRAHWEALGDNYDAPPRRVAPVVALPKAIAHTPAPNKPGAQDIVNALTVAQARELWEVLNRMFGGNR